MPAPASHQAVAELRAERETNYILGEPISATVGSTLLRVTERVVLVGDGIKQPDHSQQLSGGSNFEIIFSGQDASAIRLQYREYTADNMARQAFSQDLTYPREATTIRFRDFSMEVLALTADELTVRVLSEPPLPAID